jgi:holo-[acyl-carrier protein] synthase
MIYGIGTDIVKVARMEENITRHGRRFAEKILSRTELLEYDQHAAQANLLAKRFAVKEATLKALGTGLRMGMSLRDISVSHDELGKPLLQLSGKADAVARERGIGQGFVSIADEQEYALAFVTLMLASTD